MAHRYINFARNIWHMLEILLVSIKVSQAFDSISVEKIRSFAGLLFRWMDAYRHGLTGKAAEYVVKKHKRYRSVNEKIMNQVNELLI